MTKNRNLLLIALFFTVALFTGCSKEYYDTKNAGEDFLAANINNEGVVGLASGIQYKIIFDNLYGFYPQFAEPSLITIQAKYSVRFIDGSDYLAESDYKHTIPLSSRPDNFWLEVIPKMRKGAKWRVWVPYDNAYGIDGTGKNAGSYDIDPYTVLVYDIELIDAY